MTILAPSAAEERQARLTRRRRALERVVEKALARLDRLDGDPDLEDGADAEPSLGGITVASPLATTIGAPGGRLTWGHALDDRELDLSDDEPALGWTEAASRSGRLGQGSEHEDEPSLGSVSSQGSGSQQVWCLGANDEREHGDGDDEGELGWSEAESVGFDPFTGMRTRGLGGSTCADEDDGTGEPSLAWPERAQHTGEDRVGCQDEREEQHDREDDRSDWEPDFEGDATHPDALDQRDLGVTPRPLLIDPDDAPDTLAGARAEVGLAR